MYCFCVQIPAIRLLDKLPPHQGPEINNYEYLCLKHGL